jgi:hypothetical protein
MICAATALGNVQIQTINKLTAWLAQAPGACGHEVERFTAVCNKWTERQAKWTVYVWSEIFGLVPRRGRAFSTRDPNIDEADVSLPH